MSKKRRALAFAAALCSFGNGVANRLGAHAVDRRRRHFVARAKRFKVGHVGRAFDRGAHGVLVVLNDENHGELPGHGHVEGLVQHALTRRTIPHEAHGHVVFLAVLVRKGDAGTEANLAPNNAVSTEEVALLVKHVHRTALALARARLLAVHLGHDVLGVGAQHEGVSVVAVSGDHTVRGADGLTHAGEHGFLSNVQVAKATEFLLDVQLAAAFLKLSHEVHFAEPARVGVFVQALCRLLGSGLTSSFCGLFGRCCRCRL